MGLIWKKLVNYFTNRDPSGSYKIKIVNGEVWIVEADYGSFLNDVFSAALKDVARQKEDLNIKNEKKEQKINLENNQIDINNINENNSNHNNEWKIKLLQII